MRFPLRVTLAVALFAVLAIIFTTYEHPPVGTVQNGYRGTGMEQVFNPRVRADSIAANVAPAPLNPVEPGAPSSEVYENVKVLGHVGSDEMVRLMSAITEWVSPEAGCGYCHNEENLADDSKYTKAVSQHMLRMTMHINSTWKAHVGETGVTCYTCHRAKPVPEYVWFMDPGPQQAKGFAAETQGQNHPSSTVGLTSLPRDPLTRLLTGDSSIRVVSTTALPAGNLAGIKDAEKTYGLMVHMSQSLGVNCTFCHNTRSFASWETSTPQRVTAWQGINMVRDLNENFLQPLQSVLPPERLGNAGDAPKLTCMTCHQGAGKPLYGANMLKDYPELGAPQ
jgi:photosynthetic reaction center cytochrome c subunit